MAYAELLCTVFFLNEGKLSTWLFGSVSAPTRNPTSANKKKLFTRKKEELKKAKKKE